MAGNDSPKGDMEMRFTAPEEHGGERFWIALRSLTWREALERDDLAGGALEARRFELARCLRAFRLPVVREGRAVTWEAHRVDAEVVEALLSGLPAGVGRWVEESLEAVNAAWPVVVEEAEPGPVLREGRDFRKQGEWWEEAGALSDSPCARTALPGEAGTAPAKPSESGLGSRRRLPHEESAALSPAQRGDLWRVSEGPTTGRFQSTRTNFQQVRGGEHGPPPPGRSPRAPLTEAAGAAQAAPSSAAGDRPAQVAPGLGQTEEVTRREREERRRRAEWRR